MNGKRRKVCIGIPAGLATWSASDIISAQSKKRRDTTAPSIPTGLTARAVSSSQINLTWNASADNVKVIGYYVYVNDVPLTAASTNSFSHTGLPGGTTYRYRVSAFDGAYNYSAWSESVSATTFPTPADSTAPSVPTGLTAQAVSSSQINLTWNVSTDNVRVIGYYVYVNDTPFTPTSTNSFSHTGLSGGTTYRYRVSAFDGAYNYSAWSESVAETTFPSQDVIDHKGICPNELYFGTAITEAVTRMRALGVRWVRLDFDWSVMQPLGPNDTAFAGHETVVRALVAAGMKVLGIIDYTPSWANGGKPSKYYPPLSATDYANFASRLVSYFAPLGVHTWEIWNEQNLGNFWGPAPNPSAYVTLLQAAYTAIHKLDPTAVVVTGGLAQVANTSTTMHVLDFMTNMYRYGAAGYFDAVGNHPYDSPRLPSESYNWQLMFATSPSIRSIMSTNGDAAKRIWITEFGAPTSGTSPWGTVVTESRQAQILAEAYALVPTYTWAGPLFWYNFRDFCPYDPNSNAECFYGLIRYDGTNKPSVESYQIAPN